MGDDIHVAQMDTIGHIGRCGSIYEGTKIPYHIATWPHGWRRGADMAGTMMDVVVGAQICVAYWQEQGDEYMAADAQARLDRVISGTASDVDIDGALDWLDMIDSIE